MKIAPYLLLAFFLLTPPVMRAQVIATRAVHITLVKIRSQDEFKEVTQAVRKVEGVLAILPMSEAPGLITLGVDLAGKADTITEALEKNFAGKYSISQRTLPTGVIEINVAKGS